MCREVCSTMNSRLFEVPFCNFWSTLSMQPLTLIVRINYRLGPGTLAPPAPVSRRSLAATAARSCVAVAAQFL